MRIKQGLIKCIFNWMLKAQEYPAGYKIAESELGFCPYACLKGMTTKQLQLVAALSAAVYAKGCDDSRRWNTQFQSHRLKCNHGDRKETGCRSCEAIQILVVDEMP